MHECRALDRFRAGQHLAEPEQADGHRQEVDAVHHLWDAKGKAGIARK